VRDKPPLKRHSDEVLIYRGVNALAETTIGLYKTECIRDDSPFRRGPLTSLSGVEAITADWVHWYNTRRLMHRLGRRPPAEAEADYYAQTRDDRPAVHT
jgi:putative transposase